MFFQFWFQNRRSKAKKQATVKASETPREDTEVTPLDLSKPRPAEPPAPQEQEYQKMTQTVIPWDHPFCHLVHPQQDPDRDESTENCHKRKRIQEDQEVPQNNWEPDSSDEEGGFLIHRADPEEYSEDESVYSSASGLHSNYKSPEKSEESSPEKTSQEARHLVQPSIPPMFMNPFMFPYSSYGLSMPNPYLPLIVESKRISSVQNKDNLK